MIYVEALDELKESVEGKSVFLAGGITGCPDWQQEMRILLQDTDLILLNPRRKCFPIGDPGAAQEQIAWEHRQLRMADAILFWFPRETLCPIVLYELGAWSMTSKPIFVGIHPEYTRRQDVEIQTGLVRPDVEIVYSLEDLASQAATDRERLQASESYDYLVVVRKDVKSQRWVVDVDSEHILEDHILEDEGGGYPIQELQVHTIRALAPALANGSGA